MASKQIYARRLNELGMKEFKKNLVKKILPDESMVEDDIYTEILVIESKSIKIDKEKNFSDRLDLAEYLHGIIPSSMSNKPFDKGMWAWFALLYIDQLTNNGKQINRYEHYIPKVKGARSKLLYRHCVYGPYQAYENFGKEMKIFLSKNIYNLGDAWEQMMSNNLLSNSKYLFEVFKKRYLDPSNGYALKGSNDKVDKPKKGGTWLQSDLIKAGGKIRRFKSVVRQFQTTQRIENISVSKIENLLPKPEFN